MTKGFFLEADLNGISSNKTSDIFYDSRSCKSVNYHDVSWSRSDKGLTKTNLKRCTSECQTISHSQTTVNDPYKMPRDSLCSLNRMSISFDMC